MPLSPAIEVSPQEGSVPSCLTPELREARHLSVMIVGMEGTRREWGMGAVEYVWVLLCVRVLEEVNFTTLAR